MKDNLIKIRRYFYRMRRKAYEFFSNPKFTPKPSLNGLDDKLEPYLSFSNGFFIEVGANDGFSQSNTYYLEFGRNWKGLLVEPVPELYDRCRRLRKRSSVYNCALVSEDYQGSTISMQCANLMSMVDGAMSDSEKEKHLKLALDCLNLETVDEIQVPTRTLSSILDELAPPKIDFFSLDVEGYEFQVLAGLDLKKYRPTYILVEAWKFDEIDSYLSANNYRLIEKMSFHDYLYKNDR